MPVREHLKRAPDTLTTAVVTVSTSKFEKAASGESPEDTSGDLATEMLEEAGHEVSYRVLVPDNMDVIVGTVGWLIDRVDAIVTTGGTGITPTDVTIEALSKVADKEVEGFGEIFRMRSIEEVGEHAVLSRAAMFVIKETPVFCLPGSPNAVKTGMEIILEILEHAVVHAAGRA